MSGLNNKDVEILSFYAENGNRELYWNYLAQKPGNDGYGLLALGVVRNDNVPGQVANIYAQSTAHETRPGMTERDWEHFGVDLMRRDLAERQEAMRLNEPERALNLSAVDVTRMHAQAFENAGIAKEAWTPRRLMEMAERKGGPEAMQGVWSSVLDNQMLGITRGFSTLGAVGSHTELSIESAWNSGAYAASLTAARGGNVRAPEHRPQYPRLHRSQLCVFGSRRQLGRDTSASCQPDPPPGKHRDHSRPRPYRRAQRHARPSAGQHRQPRRAPPRRPVSHHREESVHPRRGAVCAVCARDHAGGRRFGQHVATACAKRPACIRRSNARGRRHLRRSARAVHGRGDNGADWRSRPTTNRHRDRQRDDPRRPPGPGGACRPDGANPARSRKPCDLPASAGSSACRAQPADGAIGGDAARVREGLTIAGVVRRKGANEFRKPSSR